MEQPGDSAILAPQHLAEGLGLFHLLLKGMVEINAVNRKYIIISKKRYK